MRIPRIFAETKNIGSTRTPHAEAVGGSGSGARGLGEAVDKLLTMREKQTEVARELESEFRLNNAQVLNEQNENELMKTPDSKTHVDRWAQQWDKISRGVREGVTDQGLLNRLTKGLNHLGTQARVKAEGTAFALYLKEADSNAVGQIAEGRKRAMIATGPEDVKEQIAHARATADKMERERVWDAERAERYRTHADGWLLEKATLDAKEAPDSFLYGDPAKGAPPRWKQWASTEPDDKLLDPVALGKVMEQARIASEHLQNRAITIRNQRIAEEDRELKSRGRRFSADLISRYARGGPGNDMATLRAELDVSGPQGNRSIDGEWYEHAKTALDNIANSPPAGDQLAHDKVLLRIQANQGVDLGYDVYRNPTMSPKQKADLYTAWSAKQKGQDLSDNPTYRRGEDLLGQLLGRVGSIIDLGMNTTTASQRNQLIAEASIRYMTAVRGRYRTLDDMYADKGHEKFILDTAKGIADEFRTRYPILAPQPTQRGSSPGAGEQPSGGGKPGKGKSSAAPPAAISNAQAITNYMGQLGAETVTGAKKKAKGKKEGVE